MRKLNKILIIIAVFVLVIALIRPISESKTAVKSNAKTHQSVAQFEKNVTKTGSLNLNITPDDSLERTQTYYSVGKKGAEQSMLSATKLKDNTNLALDNMRAALRELNDLEQEQNRHKAEIVKYFDKDNENRGSINVNNPSSVQKISGFYPGVKVKKVFSDPESVNNNQVEEDDDITEEIFLTGQARGYTMLNLMHPSARATVTRQLDAVATSRVKQVYLGVLVDGTFGKDFDFLNTVIKQFNKINRELYLVLYLTNGPAMRASTYSSEKTLFADYDPEEFRSKIRNDSSVRESFLKLVRSSKPSLLLNRSLNPANQNFLIVMLEDNLDSASYLSMRELAKSEVKDLAQFMRNPCVGCYEGNDEFAHGDPIETHSLLAIPGLSPRDGFSLDGTGYYFDYETSDGTLSFEQVKTLLKETKTRGVKYFGLWRAARQGIFNNTKIDPNNRNYEVPSDQDILNEVSLLEHGLE